MTPKSQISEKAGVILRKQKKNRALIFLGEGFVATFSPTTVATYSQNHGFKSLHHHSFFFIFVRPGQLEKKALSMAAPY